MSNYDNMKALIERISGQPSVISIMRLYVDIFGDLETAAVVSQCVFWSDKGTVEEGWFYKSRDDWKKAIGIKRTALDSAIKHANTLSPGLIQTKVMPAKHNSPTLFYRVDMDCLTHVVIEHLQDRFAEISKSNARSAEINKSEEPPRLVETNKSDLLKSTSPSAEISKSSYSSLHRRERSEESDGAEAPAPRKASKRKPAKETDSLLKHPAIIAYRDVMHLTPNVVQRVEIASVVGNNGQVEDWRTVLREWQLAGYKPGNVAGQLDKFKKQIAGPASAGNGGHHEPTTRNATTGTRTLAEPTSEQRAAAECINAARAAKQR